MNNINLVDLICSKRSCSGDSCPLYVGYCNCTVNLNCTEAIKATLREWVISSNYLLDNKLIKNLSSDGYTIDDFLNAIGLEGVDFV